MEKRKILIFMLMVILCFSPFLLEGQTQQESILSRSVDRDFLFENQNFGSVINSILYNVKIKYLIECTTNDKGLSSLRITKEIRKGTPLKQILYDLKSDYPVFSWNILGEIFLLQSTYLSDIRNNPFEKEVAPFSFKGDMNNLLCVLEAAEQSFILCISGHDREAWESQFHLVFNHPVKIRDVFIELSRKYNILWFVRISQEIRHTGQVKKVEEGDNTLLSDPGWGCHLDISFWKMK